MNDELSEDCMDKQDWFCEKCGLSGVVPHQEKEDVISVVLRIEAHHKRLARGCEFDLAKVRVRNPDLMDVYAWNRMIANWKPA
jgi:hypothetical protein